MHRPRRTRRTLRRYLRSPIIRFTIGALVVAIAVGIILATTDTAAALPGYIDERPTAGVGAFWAVIALGIGAAFTATLLGALHALDRADD